MPKIKTNDGEMFEGETWEQVVDAMRLSTPLEPDPDIDVYMKETARRAKVWNGSIVDTKTPETFIRSLARGKLLEILEE